MDPMCNNYNNVSVILNKLLVIIMIYIVKVA